MKLNAHIKKKISFGKKNWVIINLTEPLRYDVTVYPGDPKLEKTIISSFDNGNYQYHCYTIGDHLFHPHGDAPNHQNPQYIDNGFEYWTLDYVFNKGCLIDLSKSYDTCVGKKRYLKKITVDHLSPYIKLIRKKGALIIRTGYDKLIEANYKHTHDSVPYIEKSAADLISQFSNIKVIGIDSLTIDQPYDNYAHQKLCDKFIVESLVNLSLIPKKFVHSFYLQTSPVAIIGATGGPVIAYAYCYKKK